MTIQFRTSLAGDNASSSSTTQSVTLPTGWQARDFCVIGGRVGNATGTFTTPAGWNVINAATYATGGYAYCFYYRVLQAGDANPTFTYSVASTWCWVSIGIYSDVAAALSLDAQGAAVTQNATAGTTFTPPAAIATGSGEASIIVTVGRNSAVISVSAGATTPAAGWTAGAIDVALLNSGNNFRIGATYYQLGVSGTVTPGSFSFTTTGGAATIFFTSQQVLVKEAAGAPASLLPQQLKQRIPLQTIPAVRQRAGSYGR
jgi:hypothetical protein